MLPRAFKQVDVFTASPYLGNPLAVVLDAQGLDDAAMQRFAQWTNLSETTFVLPPTEPLADYRVRIFTPSGEVPFAGHPTLGTCHSWLQAGGQPKTPGLIVQQCAKELVTVRQDSRSRRLAFAAPALSRSALDALVLEQVCGVLGTTPAHIKQAQLLDNGSVWLGLLMDHPDTVLQLTPQHAEVARLGIKLGVAAFYPATGAPPLLKRANREAQAFGVAIPSNGTPEPDMEVRAFAACLGINEDPVTGSLNASLAQWLMQEGLAPQHYVAAQGTCLGRTGRVYLERDAAGQVWVGGYCVTCIDGSVAL